MSVWGKPLLIRAEFGRDIYDPSANPIEQGNISSTSGENIDSGTRLRTDGFISVISGKQYRIDMNLARVFCYYYNDDYSYVVGSNSGWVDVPAVVTVPEGKAFMRIVLAKSAGGVRPGEVNYLIIQPAQNSMFFMS